MRVPRSLIISVGVVLALALPAFAAARALNIGGSTSVLPLAEKLAALYHKEYPSIPKPKVTGGESDIGINSVAEGRFDIGDSSRDPLSSDPHGLDFYKIARDGVCIITNDHNPLGNLSEEAVVKIFTGEWRDWSQVPGAGISGPIDLFDRDGASGTQDAFQHIFLGESLKISPSASAKTSNGLEETSVATDKQAIGFVSFAYTKSVHTVDYSGVACNLRNARSGQYLGVRNFWMVTKGPAKGAVAKFIAWVTSGKRSVDNIITSSWIAIK